jgi:hypothetical protein
MLTIASAELWRAETVAHTDQTAEAHQALVIGIYDLDLVSNFVADDAPRLLRCDLGSANDHKRRRNLLRLAIDQIATSRSQLVSAHDQALSRVGIDLDEISFQLRSYADLVQRIRSQPPSLADREHCEIDLRNLGLAVHQTAEDLAMVEKRAPPLALRTWDDQPRPAVLALKQYQGWADAWDGR